MTVQFDALRNSYADTIHITISAKSYPSMTSYVRLYLFITGTKFLSFAARLLQQEARPQGDLEQNMVVYFTTTERERERERERDLRKQQQELHNPANIWLRTSGKVRRVFALQKVFIHSSILCSFPILYFILQNRFHPSYVVFLNFRHI